MMNEKQKCDRCSNEIKNFHSDLYHVTIILNGKFINDARLCCSCFLQSLRSKKIPMME